MKTIVAIDDNPSQRYAMCRMIQRTDFQIVSAATAADGLLAVNKLHPDLVLLDVHLPDSNGFEVCREIKATLGTTAIPVVMYSSIAQGGDSVNQAYQLGASSFLFFPVSSEQLNAVVDGALARGTGGDQR